MSMTDLERLAAYDRMYGDLLREQEGFCKAEVCARRISAGRHLPQLLAKRLRCKIADREFGSTALTRNQPKGRTLTRPYFGLGK